MGKLFVPVTGPMETKHAIAKAVAVARQSGFSLCVLYVIDRESVARLERYKVFISEEASYLTDGMKRDADKYLAYARKTGESSGVAVETRVLEGDVAEEIARAFQDDPDEIKIMCLARKSDGETVKESLGSIERKLYLKYGFDTLITGAAE